jgi:integrase
MYRILFWFGGKQYHKSLKTTNKDDAEAKKGGIEESLQAMEKGWIPIPPPDKFWPFLFSGGKLEAKPSVADVFTLDRLFNRYEQEMPPGTMEANSLDTFRLHKKHLLRILDGRTAAQAVATTDMQRYVNERGKEKHRDKLISSRTIKKEVATFRAVWNWGKFHSLVTGDAPTRGLKYEKERQKPPFQTWEVIEQQVARGGFQEEEIDDLWNALFLSKEQIAGCLEHVKANAAVPFIYPMFVFVAHTGARRSEMMRSQVDDLDFEAKQVCIREKKRDRSVKETRRYVRMTSLMEQVLKEWLDEGHPGGRYTFCQADVVPRSRKRSSTTGHQSGEDRATSLKGRLATVRERVDRPGQEPLTPKEATHHFKKTLAGSKWEVVRGFHVFRHAFASNYAAAGARQDYIDSMMGHQTEEMRRRYRHLFPQEMLDVQQKVFG